MRVAVVILNFNGAALLPRFLPSIIKHSDEADIFIIDNGSTDDSINWVENSHPQVRLIRLEKNLGFCAGYNEGLKLIDADVYVLLNSDVEVTEGWIRAPLELLSNDPTIVAVQPKILSLKNKQEFEYAGAAGGFLDLLCYPYCRGRIFDQIEQDHGQYNDTSEVMWGSGACSFIRSIDFHRLGGFEPSFFAHMEEIDLCWRLRRLGKKIFYTGQSTVYHLGGGTLPVSSPRKTYLNFRNNLSLMMRNLRAADLLLILPIRLLLDLIAALKFMLEGNAASSLSVLRAWNDFVINLRKEIQKRRATKELPFVSNSRFERIRVLIWKRYVVS